MSAMDNRDTTYDTYVETANQKWVERNNEPHWVGSVTTNTDGEVKVKFYYDDGVVYIY